MTGNRRSKMMGWVLSFACVSVVSLGTATALAQQSQEEQDKLRKAAQNPVASMISVPFQNNTTFRYGLDGYDDDGTQNALLIQPVYPISLNARWNLISRTIAPVVYQPDVAGSGSAFGLGDLTETLFLSPAKPGKLIWGVGPVFGLPTATDDLLGSDKWSAGGGVVLLTMPGKWVIGAVVQNQWSFAGSSSAPDVNSLLFQYFINRNFNKGWYFTSQPTNYANWNADSGDRWTVPLGGGVGRVFKIGKRPVNVTAQAYYNVVRPDNQVPSGPFTLRLMFVLLYPKH